MKVTSTPEVPGPSRSWNPAPAAPSSPLDFLNCSFERESRELERVVPQSLEREPHSFLSVFSKMFSLSRWFRWRTSTFVSEAGAFGGLLGALRALLLSGFVRHQLKPGATGGHGVTD